ncbi:hemicentin-1-like isoform X2 [Amphibalanus amphitrite]|uniref:hemicentin-1-like isoform X2 n=1 Tax=Amphibalanus amphitrite TaxID=1232801 RepID=UPI001C920F59|nr:hemicentin-1-like isoform X2 [Amphibalanus amphitrite]
MSSSLHPWRMSFLRGWAALLTVSLAGVTGRVQQIDITGLVGDSVRLPCEIDEEKCGEVHNIQWYRGDGDTRVFIYSELANVDTSENMLQGRGFFEYIKGSPVSELQIRNLKADDESLYKCELTYLEVRDNCAVIQFVNLTTIAKPKKARILLKDGTEAGSIIGPFEEDAQLYLKCESAGGKPAASVTWWNDTINMGGVASSTLSPDGTAVTSSELRTTLTRYDLEASFECQVNNVALKNPLRSRVYVLLHVRPLSVQLTGLNGPVLAGTKVTLVCVARGAKPPANITWSGWPGTGLPKTTVYTQPDGTTDTVSSLTLTATRSAHLRTVTCEASNHVTRVKAEPPHRAEVVVKVLYAPVTTVSPAEAAANETDDVLLFCRYDSNPANLTTVAWYKDGVLLDLSKTEKFGGGTLENPSLLIKNTSRRDAGRYRCEVANDVGVGRADNEAAVHVQFPPEVRLSVTPSEVIEADRSDVTLVCDVTEGDPAELQAVRWYRDGELLATPAPCQRLAIAPVSDRSGGAPCTDGPSRLLLSAVSRADMANYSCQGRSRAGWGPRSVQQRLLVQYPPQRTILLHKPAVVQKGQPVTLTCEVDDPGYPPVNKYLWMRGSHVITDIRTRQWRIWSASLEEDARFSCVALNAVGSSAEGTALVDVLAKPQFIERLPLYLGALMNSSSISVTCRVECSPLCSLQWLRNDEVISASNPLYSIKTSTLDPDPRTNDLESVVSTLTWNMSAWPGQMLDRVKDNANYTCRSSSNVVGPGVSSTTFFTVEYPPRNVTVDPAVVNVRESSTPVAVRCTSNAFPEASYVWTNDGDVVQKGDRLLLDPEGRLRRSSGGKYVCHARNKHGVLTATVTVLLQYKPQCAIRQTEEDGEYLLLCEVDAVPDDVTFGWFFNNQTLKGDIHTEGTVSTLIVRPGSGDFGTYSCHVNNTVGAGVPCELDFTGVGDWRIDSDQISVIMVVTTVAATAVTAAIACGVLYLVCRRRRTKHNYGEPGPMLDRDAYYQREARALIGPSLLPGPPSNPDIAKLPASDSSTKSSTNGSGCSSYETRPIHESLAMHKTPSKTFAAPPPPGGRQFYTSGPPGQRQRHAEVATSIQNTRATPRRAQTAHFGRRRDGDSSTAGTPVHDAYAVQSGVPGYGAPSRVQKDYVPSEYAVLQFSGASHEIDV